MILDFFFKLLAKFLVPLLIKLLQTYALNPLEKKHPHLRPIIEDIFDVLRGGELEEELSAAADSYNNACTNSKVC